MSPPGDRKCGICGVLVVDHKAGACPYCYGPLDHHEPGRLEECRAGRARMAAARRAAGSPLDAGDRRALEGASS